jgi:hypothetical protein
MRGLNWLPWRRRPAPMIDEALWARVMARFGFLQRLTPSERERLHRISSGFLASKEFHGASGFEITDEVAVTVAAQACLPLLHLGPVERVLDWYDDFVGIVIHPGGMLARRERVDEAGVVHRYREALSGEAMDGGPVALSWEDVAAADESAPSGYNVVIHEFAHKLDLRDGALDGCPPLPERARRQAWQTCMQRNYDEFCSVVNAASRFAGLVEPVWLDDYAAESMAEFFAVTLEAYFVARETFAQHHGELSALYDSFFRPATA